MKLSDLLNKLRGKAPDGESNERSAKSMEQAAAAAEAESYSAFVPSQQDDRPPH